MKITGPQRIALNSHNESGQTTLLQLISGQLVPDSREIKKGVRNLIYLDQRTECLDKSKTILENFLKFKPTLNETDCRSALAKFLFPNKKAFKRSADFSGGERL